MRAVAVNHASGLGRKALRGAVNAPVQRQGFAGSRAAELHAIRV